MTALTRGRLRRAAGGLLAVLALAGALGGGASARAGADSGPAGDPGRWSWPVPAAAIARPFVAPATPYGAGHRGVDLVASPGAEVRAPEAGVVWFAGVVVDRPVISIRHADGLLSSFEPVDPVVAAGDRVERGQVIGTLLAGHCARGCLHLGARVGGTVYVNPLLYLGGLPRSVLLPVRRGRARVRQGREPVRRVRTRRAEVRRGRASGQARGCATR